MLPGKLKYNLMNDIDLNAESEAGKEFRYLLVGNIIGQHCYGETKQVKNGTKHFRPGAKVYLFPHYGGMGHQNIPVYGLPRKSGRKIEIVIRAVLIKNVRVSKTFDPKMIEKVDACHFYNSFKNTTDYTLEKFAGVLNSNNQELSTE
jgi:hypothetical protein